MRSLRSPEPTCDLRSAARFARSCSCSCSKMRLRSMLYERQQSRLHQQRAEQRRTLIGSGDRSERIRTYNFPQNRVTDHRINLNLYKLDAIIAGDLGELIGALRDYDKKQRLGQTA